MSAVLTYSGVPSAADLQAKLDAYGAVLKAVYASMGVGAPSESGTGVLKALAVRNVQVNNTLMRARHQQFDDAAAKLFSYATITQMAFGGQIRDLNNIIGQNIPAEWNFVQSGHTYLDTYLTRLNGNSSSVPATPSFTLTLTPTTGGGIPPTTTGQEPRVKIALVSTSGDWIESQPTAASGQSALTGKYNGWTLGGLTGTVPTGVAKLRIYRQFDGNAGVNDPYYYDRDVAVTAGAAWPAITIGSPDIALHQAWSPVVWMGLPLLPEEAAIIALALSSQPTGALTYALPVFPDSAMVSPGNVVLNATNGYLGVGNTPSHGEFARWTSGTTALGGILQTNSASANLQGFAGATRLQARVVSALNAGASLSAIGITYLDAGHPTSPQATSIAGPFALGSALGSTAEITGLPTGAVVQTVTGFTVGTSVSGTIVFEGLAPRSI